MACSGWLFVLVILTMTSATQEQAACSQTEAAGDVRPEAASERDGQRTGAPGLNVSLVPPPGVGYLGRGFDVYSGNLLSTDGDTGFRLPVVSLNYDLRRRTSDHRYVLPDYTDLLYVTTAQSDDVTEVRSHADLLRMFSKRIQFQHRHLQDGYFMASRDYKDFRSGAHTALYRVEERPMYRMSFDGQRLLAVQAFKDAVQRLPASCGSEHLPSYLHFLQAFGTHVITHVTLGRVTVRHVTIPTRDVLTEKLHRQSLQDIFAKRINISSSSAQANENNAVPLRVTIEPMVDFFTESLLGQDTLGLLSKRQCLVRALTVYCRRMTSSTCQQNRNTSTAIRYGDSIQLNSDKENVVLVMDKITLIGSDVASRLVKGDDLVSGQETLRVLPPRGDEERYGEPLNDGDVFTLSANKNEDSRVQVSWNEDISLNTLNTSPIYFRYASQSSVHKDTWQLFVKKNKGRPYLLSVETSSRDRWAVTGAGPWSLTVETARAVVSVVVDPCRRLCYPGVVVTSAVLLPAGTDGVRQIRVTALPPVLGMPTRAGNWTIKQLELTDMTTMTSYTAYDSVTLSNPCAPCTAGQWSTASRSLHRFQPTRPNASPSVDAEFYFHLLTPQSGLVTNSSVAELKVVGYNVTDPEPPLSCSSSPCRNGGRCASRDDGALCECPSLWTGRTCDTPCFAELFSASVGALSSVPGVFGSSGRPSGSDLRWLFSPSSSGDLQGTPQFLLLKLPMEAKVSAITIPSTIGLHQIDIEYYDISSQAWKGNVTAQPANKIAQNYLMSVPGGGDLMTDRLKLTYKDRVAALNVSGLAVYGCTRLPRPQTNNHVADILSSPLHITKTDSFSPEVYENPQESLPRKLQMRMVREEVALRFVIGAPGSCEVSGEAVLWSVGRQIGLCPSHLELVNLTVTSTQHSHQRTVSADLLLHGEQPLISPAKRKAADLMKAGRLSVGCGVEEVAAGRAAAVSSGGAAGGLEARVTGLSVAVIVLVLLCLLVFTVFLLVMTRRYRHIKNELTTLRKLKMQKRIAKRQELQPQVPSPHAFTLPRPGSTTGSSTTTTSIPGRLNGQPRPLRYSQSLHGLGDRARLAAAPPAHAAPPPAAPGSGRTVPLDPANYIIASPLRTPSPVGTKSGEESDTVQSVC